MSLTVTAEEIDKAKTKRLTDDEFVAIIRTSLPFAYEAVERMSQQLDCGSQVAFEMPLHMSDDGRNQLLRVFASTSMRQALERHFGIAELAFQNCHYIGAATKRGTRHHTWQAFTSKEGQVLAQRPELRDC